MPRYKTFFPLLLAPFILSGCTSAGRTCQTSPGTTLPVYFAKGNIPFTMAMVNETPAAMMIDTGSAGSSITPDLANQADLKLEPLDRPITFFGVGGLAPVRQTNVDQFTLGAVTGKNLIFEVMTLAPPGHTVVNALDGIIGTDILEGYDIELDFPDGKLSLYPPSPCSFVSPPWAGTSKSISATINDYGAISLPVKLDGETLQATLDTGASVSTVPRSVFMSAVSQAEAAAPATKIKAVTAGGILIETYIYRVKQFTVGDETANNFPLAVSAPGSADFIKAEAMLAKANEDDMVYDHSEINDTTVLGEDYIRTHRIFISYSTHTVYVQPASAVQP